MAPVSLERGNPEFGRLEVDVAGAYPERLAHSAAGEREGAIKRPERRLAAWGGRGPGRGSGCARQR